MLRIYEGFSRPDSDERYTSIQLFVFFLSTLTEHLFQTLSISPWIHGFMVSTSNVEIVNTLYTLLLKNWKLLLQLYLDLVILLIIQN